MSREKEICIICAWRATCQKQFSLKAGQTCPDYCKDLTLRESETEQPGRDSPQSEA